MDLGKADGRSLNTWLKNTGLKIDQNIVPMH